MQFCSTLLVALAAIAPALAQEQGTPVKDDAGVYFRSPEDAVPSPDPKIMWCTDAPIQGDGGCQANNLQTYC
ncbi:hypothetical protein E4U43_006190, partial [Claviceps pusilla]